ncbi:MAG: hypothetical protein KKH60_11820, partial [Proteobacteria bacterium]|nr:hypothetical protein [Pseudomonadota bacterium]
MKESDKVCGKMFVGGRMAMFLLFCLLLSGLGVSSSGAVTSRGELTKDGEILNRQWTGDYEQMVQDR